MDATNCKSQYMKRIHGWFQLVEMLLLKSRYSSARGTLPGAHTAPGLKIPCHTSTSLM